MIPLPVKGQKINAWARELTEEVNRLAPMGSSGLLVRGGHGAFGFEPLPSNPKQIRTAATQDFGCFGIKEISGTTVTLQRCFYAIGGKLYKLDTGNVDTLDVTAANNRIVGLRIAANNMAASIYTWSSLSALQTAQANLAYYCLPLYQFKVENGKTSVLHDFRFIPTAIMYEAI